MFNSREAAKHDKQFKTGGPANAMTLIFQEGTGYATHKEDPEYYHVPHAAEKAANHYIGSLGEGEEPNPDAVRLFGLKQSKKGDWYHSRAHSQLANVKTASDYMTVAVRNKTTGKSYKLEQGIHQPTMMIAPSEEGHLDDRAFRAGEHVNAKTGERLMVHPLSALGQSHIETIMAFNEGKRNGIKDPKFYRDAMKTVSNHTHGDLAVHHAFNHTINNMCNTHDAIDPVEQNVIDQGKTARFVKCFCPYCVVNDSTHPTNQLWDMQHHEEATKRTQDPKIRAAYFAGFPVSKEAGEFGKVGRRSHHRVLYGTKAEQTIINHHVNFRQDEDNHAAVVAPRVRHRARGGEGVSHLYSPSTAINRAVHADDSYSGE